jgi:MoaD family protein
VRIGRVLFYRGFVRVRVNFYSYFKELAGTSEFSETMTPGSTVEDLLQKIFVRFPKLTAMRKSMLVAVGVDYQKGNFVLKDGDEVSLFPPVQGG